MSRIDPLQPSSFDVRPLSSPISCQALSTFSQLLSSCAGPHGKNHVVRNTCGGHMTITSSCLRLLSSMSLSRSEIKLAASAFTGHLQQVGDCGLFMAHMCLYLTTSALDLDVHHSTVSSAFQLFVSIIVDYIKSHNCEIRVNVDFTNLQILFAYVRSILTSKTLLNIPPQELQNLALVIVNAFVKAIPSVPLEHFSNGVYVLGEEKQPTKNCRIVDGILLDAPEICQFSARSELIVRKDEISMEDGLTESAVKVALITCSMSGDLGDGIIETTFEGTEEQFKDLEECVMGKMRTLCSDLDQKKVGIILCQKVIHPKVKSFLRSKGILFVDRLGSQPIPYIRDLTGCKPITSVLQSGHGIEQCLGKLTSVTSCNVDKKSSLCLQNATTNIVSLIVCAEWEERLSEMKHCVKTCLQGLESLGKHPWLLMGGGCWQMHCSHILRNQVVSRLPDIAKTLSCTDTTARKLLTVFRSALHKWCLLLTDSREHLSFDPSSLHSWRVPFKAPVSLSEEERKLCACGMKTASITSLQDLDIVLTQNDLVTGNEKKSVSGTCAASVDGYNFAVFDNYTACLEALHKGVLTAGLLLSIGQYVCDRN